MTKMSYQINLENSKEKSYKLGFQFEILKWKHASADSWYRYIAQMY